MYRAAWPLLLLAPISFRSAKGHRVDSDPRIFFLFGCLCSGSCVRQSWGRPNHEWVFSERNCSAVRVLVVFERTGKSKDRRRGWRECHVSQIGLSIGRRLGREWPHGGTVWKAILDATSVFKVDHTFSKMEGISSEVLPRYPWLFCFCFSRESPTSLWEFKGV